MKILQTLVLILCVFSIVFIACEKQDVSKSGDSLIISINEAETDATHPYTVQLDSIIDYRCPSTANCIWEGNAEVHLLLFDNRSNTGNIAIVLNTIENINLGLEKSAQVGEYIYTLISVEPYPETPEDTRPKEAQITIIKK